MEISKSHYVYALVDPRVKGLWEYKNLKIYSKPFYIGVGRGYRSTSHFTKSSIKNDININKVKLIKEISDFKTSDKHIVLYNNLTQEEANIIEIDLIKHFGKIYNGGILTNMVDGGNITNANIVGGDNIHSKKVYQYDLEGNFVKEHFSLRNIKHSVHFNTIGDACRGNINVVNDFYHKAGNYIWLYEYKGNKIKVRDKQYHREIYLYSLKNNKLIKKYNSAKECMNDLNINKHRISDTIVKKLRFKNNLTLTSSLKSEEELNEISIKYFRLIIDNFLFFDVLTASEYLKISKKSLQHMITYGKLPSNIKHYRANEYEC